MGARAARRSLPAELAPLLWLAGLAVFLGLTLAVTLSVCLAQRLRYARKLRAATAAAYGERSSCSSRQEVVKSSSAVPGTNRHATEGSNPVWMTAGGYDNWAAQGGEEEEGVVSSLQ